MNGSRWAVAAAAGALLTVSACSVDRAGGTSAEEPTVLTFAQGIDGAPPPQLVLWAEEVGRLTDGAIEIRFENAWRLGDVNFEAATLEDVQAGEVDLAWVGARVFDRLGVTSFQALMAPLLVDSHDLQRAVFEDGIPEEMLAGVEQLDLVGVGILPGPMRKTLGIEAPFVAPADFAGKVVGMQHSALVEETYRTLGATTKPLPSSAKLDGVDAYEQQLGSITGNGYQARAKGLTANLNWGPRPFVMVAGEGVHDELTAEQQQALRDASHNAMVDALLGAAEEDENSAAVLCGSALTIATVDEAGLAEFKRALEPVYSSLRADPTTSGFLDRIEALKESVAAAPDTMDCGTADTASGAIPNGTYQKNVTAADLERYCEPGDPSLSNVDDLTDHVLQIEITGERIVESQFPVGKPEERVIGWTGTYRTYGDTLELIETGYREGHPMTWSWDGNELRLSEPSVKQCDAFIVWLAHPWVKVDEEPTS